ncbi:MAG: TonB-dependent receptor, partial [FCB group bacterium]|nr:TonB-dependent receptor [FCB group bacterium]
MGMRKRFSKKFIMVTLTGLIAVMLPLTAVAGTINGTITDKTDGEVLMGATVNVKSAISGFEPRGTAADKDGFFEFTDMLPGKYIVIVSSIGFTPQTFSEIEVTESGNQSMKVSLTPTYIDLDAISVTASRRPEKLVEAPASVAVVDAESVEARTTLTPTEHLKGLAAVDVASTGLNQSNVVVRGFNNIFSGALLVLTDNRIARVPSLRFNAYNFISTINEDIERIEIVSGPGSALYGPNSASGVMHIITKSPFASQGTTFSLGGGERDLVIGSFRHAGTYNDRIGYKITGQYYQGHDWEHTEQAEEDNDLIQKYLPTADGPEFVGDSIPAERDFDINKLAGDGRLDFLIGDNSSLIVNSGFSRSSSIELTGLGAGQAIDWTYWFAQTRYRYKDLFIQGFVNASDAGDTYLLQTGQLIVDKSKLWAGQIQHSYSTSDNLSFTYGFDALFTRPNTEATINGGNEENDDIDEFGIYLQSDAQLNDKLKLVTAVRLDDNNRLKDMVISPRAGLVYQPVENHNLRATYNRAYSTPDNNNLYLDIMQTNDMGDLGTNFETALGFRPEVDIRVQGVPESGFHWRINDNGPQFRSSFAPVARLTTSDYIDFNDPMFTNVMWGIGRSATIAGFKGKLLAAGLSEPQIEA